MAARQITALQLVLASCGPELGEAQSHRHLAEEWCRENLELQQDCGQAEYPPEVLEEKQQRCEADVAWDWTDECGDINWEWRSCVTSVSSCEEFAHVGNAGLSEDNTDPAPCAEEWIAHSYCFYFDRDGNPVDHGADRGPD